MTMPVFVLKAKDRLSLDAVEQYRRLCEMAGLLEQAAEVAKAWREIRDWQDANPGLLQWPDHPHVPAEGGTSNV